jgi:hypothetical protein
MKRKPGQFKFELNMVLRDKRGEALVASDGSPLRKNWRTNSPAKVAAFFFSNGFEKKK